jgi:hypothetical protein
LYCSVSHIQANGIKWRLVQRVSLNVRTSFSRVSSKLNAQHSLVLMLRELHGTCGDLQPAHERKSRGGRGPSLRGAASGRLSIFAFYGERRVVSIAACQQSTPSHVKPGKGWVHSKSLLVAHQAHGKGARCHFHFSGAGCDVMEWDGDGIGRDKGQVGPLVLHNLWGSCEPGKSRWQTRRETPGATPPCATPLFWGAFRATRGFLMSC